jgi:hypothetical protein
MSLSDMFTIKNIGDNIGSQLMLCLKKLSIPLLFCEEKVSQSLIFQSGSLGCNIVIVSICEYNTTN